MRFGEFLFAYGPWQSIAFVTAAYALFAVAAVFAFRRIATQMIRWLLWAWVAVILASAARAGACFLFHGSGPFWFSIIGMFSSIVCGMLIGIGCTIPVLAVAAVRTPHCEKRAAIVGSIAVGLLLMVVLWTVRSWAMATELIWSTTT